TSSGSEYACSSRARSAEAPLFSIRRVVAGNARKVPSSSSSARAIERPCFGFCNPTPDGDSVRPPLRPSPPERRRRESPPGFSRAAAGGESARRARIDDVEVGERLAGRGSNRHLPQLDPAERLVEARLLVHLDRRGSREGDAEVDEHLAGREALGLVSE